MKRPFIKFCGFQHIEDVQLVSRLPVDAIGFILVPNRKRTVSPKQLPELISHLSVDQMAIGVLQNPDWDEVNYWLHLAPFSGLQLHGDESAVFCQKIKKHFPSLHLTKVMHIQEAFEGQEMLAEYQPWVDAILLDTAAGNIKGGTGKLFDWECIHSWKETCRKWNLPCWVAGGLHSRNVFDLVARYRPDGVDVSSGIEKNQQKDGAKMRFFLERVNNANAITR